MSSSLKTKDGLVRKLCHIPHQYYPGATYVGTSDRKVHMGMGSRRKRWMFIQATLLPTFDARRRHDTRYTELPMEMYR